MFEVLGTSWLGYVGMCVLRSRCIAWACMSRIELGFIGFK